MMKKLVVCMLVVVMVIGVFGCISSGGEDIGVFKALKKEGIIDDDLELIDEVTEIGLVNFRTEYTYSIYENDDSELIAIFYDKSPNSRTDYDYIIRIYTDVTMDEVEYIDDASGLDYYCEYKDGRKSEDNKYDMSNVKEYYAYKKESLSGVDYKFEEKE